MYLCVVQVLHQMHHPLIKCLNYIETKCRWPNTNDHDATKATTHVCY